MTGTKEVEGRRPIGGQSVRKQQKNADHAGNADHAWSADQYKRGENADIRVDANGCERKKNPQTAQISAGGCERRKCRPHSGCRRLPKKE